MVPVSLSDRLDTVDLAPRIGTRIHADANALLSGAHTAEIQDMLERRGVVLVRDLHFDDEELLRFSRILGPLMEERGSQLFPISLDPDVTRHATQYLTGSFFWHMDGAAGDCPPSTAILNAQKLSPTGGQTQFSNSYAAWDDLPNSEKKAIEALQVVHSFETPRGSHVLMPAPAELAQRRSHFDKTLPLVWTHRSGRKSLLLGSTASYIVGMDRVAGHLLLDELAGWATQSRYVYCHEWQVGDLLIWNNRGTLHRATLYDPDSGRLMTRTTILGDEKIA